MVANDDFDGKATYLNCFYMLMNFEQKYLKPATVKRACPFIYFNCFALELSLLSMTTIDLNKRACPFIRQVRAQNKGPLQGLS